MTDRTDNTGAPAMLDPSQRYEFEGELADPAGTANALVILARDVPRRDWRVTHVDLDGRRRWTAVYEKGATFDPDAEARDAERAAEDELYRLARENRALREDNARLNGAADDLNSQLGELHRERTAGDRPPFRISGAGEAALVVTALVELHRATCGAARYDNRFLAAATRIVDQLAADTSPPG